MKRAEMPYDIFKRLAPIYNGMNPDEYVAEPYVTPGNIDGPDSPYYGRAGWTWYTGSASWLQKVIVDWILGIRADKDALIVDPCIPQSWNKYYVRRKFQGKTFHINVFNNNRKYEGIKYIEVNGRRIESNRIYPVYDNNAVVNVILE